ncbi:uncharacterized protein LOC6618215 isoform X4 [Drosophila sechellia]|uniref:uncharacterized protein LOC6618215 isoform X4 n=1 Tax=Drosophila sechellia TaxID=7238 RepID=UPI0013DDF005|nr:uncharacterized protein LOC6618215 isoform X4 [Drosophila sechellia]
MTYPRRIAMWWRTCDPWERRPLASPSTTREVSIPTPGDTRFVRRSCYFFDASPTGISCDDGPDPVVPFMNFLGCALCDTDLCNAAAGLSTTPLVIVLSVLGLLVLPAT